MSLILSAAIAATAVLLGGCTDADSGNNDKGRDEMSIPSCPGIYNANALAQCITAGLGTREERITALYLWCRTRIRYELSYSQCRSVYETLSSGYGDCADKSKVLATMLESLGETTWLVQITCEPRCSHRIVAVEGTTDESSQMSKLSGGGGGWKVINFKGKRLIPLDSAAASGYVGYIPDKYTHSTGEGSWQFSYPIEIKRGTSSIWCHAGSAASAGE